MNRKSNRLLSLTLEMPRIIAGVSPHSSPGETWTGIIGLIYAFSVDTVLDFRGRSSVWRLAKLEGESVFHLKCQTFSLKYIHRLRPVLPKSEYLHLLYVSPFLFLRTSKRSNVFLSLAEKKEPYLDHPFSFNRIAYSKVLSLPQLEISSVEGDQIFPL